jgi:SRSO17 transposase
MGLLLPCERKSVEPMAAMTAPARVSAQHQSLLHFVSSGGWSDERILSKVRELVMPEMQRHGPIEAWIIDDTGFPKQGTHSVGVARQYCGQLGKQDNCQVAVSLSLANHHASLPVAYRLYLPKEWVNVVARSVCPATSSSKRSQKLLWSNCIGHAKRVCRPVWS